MSDSRRKIIDNMREDAEVSSPLDVLRWADRLDALEAEEPSPQLPLLGEPPTLPDLSDPPTFSAVVEELTGTHEHGGDSTSSGVT